MINSSDFFKLLNILYYQINSIHVFMRITKFNSYFHNFLQANSFEILIIVIA